MFKFKGIAALVVAIIVVVGFLLWIPALRYILPAAIVVGVVVALILRAWHERKPVKTPEEESIKLHLND